MFTRRRLIHTLGATAATAVGARSRAALAQSKGGAPLKIGFVYVSPIGEAGWTFQHDLARRELESALAGKVQTKYIESVAEGADAERVFRELAQGGHQLIFGTSFGYMNFMEKVARQFPNTIFEHATGYKAAKNLAVYNARFYEGRYLCGVIAGRMTRSNLLGYVAAFPIPEVLQGINAFMRGARSVNPKAEVRVVWVNSWYDPGKEREAANTVMAQKCDIVTHHTDSTAVVQAAEARGAFAFGYHSDMSRFGPKAHLTASTHNWGPYYTKTTRDVLAGAWKTHTLWGGMREGFVQLAPLSAAVPASVREEVARLEAGLKAATFHPFAGPVKDQAGKELIPAGRNMTDDELGKMNYYVEGVASQLPKS
jgi:simple sugar transport system substrate-binding protein